MSRIRSSPPDPRLVQAWRLRAAGRLDEAAAAFRALLADSPLTARAHYGLAAIHWDRAKAAETEAHLRQALALMPDDARGLAFLGCVRAASGAAAEARVLLARIDLRRADPVRDCPVIARLAQALGEAAVAAAALQRYLTVCPNDTRAYRELLALGSGHARPVLDRLSRRYPSQVMPRAAKVLLAKRNQAGALQAALRIDPGCALLLWTEGKRLLASNDSQAIDYLHRAWLQATDGDVLAPPPAVAGSLVAALAQFGYLPELLAMIDLTMARHPHDGDLLLVSARSLARLGLASKAWGLVRRLLARQPARADVWRLAAELHAERGAWPQAVAFGRRAAALDPAHPEGWSLVTRVAQEAAGAARLWARLGRWQEAAQAWQAVVMGAPDNSAAWQGLAEVWEQLGWTPERRRWVARWLPERKSCGAWLCAALAATDPGTAERALAAALQVASEAEEWSTVGHLALALDMPEVAAMAFQRLIQQEPGHAEAFFGYGQALYLQGLAKEALPWLRNGLVVADRCDSWLLLAEAELEAGEAEAALRSLYAANERWPGDAQIWYQLAMAWRAYGHQGRAAWALARFAQLSPGLTRAERRAIVAPLAGMEAAIRFYDDAWQPARQGRLTYWHPPRSGHRS